MKKQDILENLVKGIYIGIGSNLGYKKRNIEKAKFMISQKGIKILASSSYYESPSWPNKNYPKFLNIVLKIRTGHDPMTLLQIFKDLERNFGKRKAARNAPRICDIDIIDYKNQIMINQVVLPHPRMHIRNFVLFPLFELNKDWKHPLLKSHIKNLLLSLSKSDITSIKQI